MGCSRGGGQLTHVNCTSGPKEHGKACYRAGRKAVEILEWSRDLDHTRMGSVLKACLGEEPQVSRTQDGAKRMRCGDLGVPSPVLLGSLYPELQPGAV